jgi:hypothetical protein
MLIGDKNAIAIECYHETTLDEGRSVFGRMCIWAGGHRLGDINEPACMLNMTEGHLQALLKHIDSLEDPALCDRDGRGAFEFLDHALYLDDQRPDDQVAADAQRFFKFDFLTNGGESFDRTKSFIIAHGDDLRILWKDDKNGFAPARVPRATFVLTARGFLNWMEEQRQSRLPQ